MKQYKAFDVKDFLTDREYKKYCKATNTVADIMSSPTADTEESNNKYSTNLDTMRRLKGKALKMYFEQFKDYKEMLRALKYIVKHTQKTQLSAVSKFQMLDYVTSYRSLVDNNQTQLDMEKMKLGYVFRNLNHMFWYLTEKLEESEAEYEEALRFLFNTAVKIFGNPNNLTPRDIGIDIDPKSKIGNSNSIIPYQYALLVDKTSEVLFNKDFPIGETTDIFVGNHKKKGNITIPARVNFDAIEKDSNVKFTAVMDKEDKAVYEAVASLWLAGNEYITTSMIYKTMTGDCGGSDNSITEKQKEKIKNCILKLGTAKLSIDNENEYNAYPTYGQFKYSSTLLPMEIITWNINGAEIKDCIHLFREPPIYTYASQKNQVSMIQMELLSCPTVYNTDTSIVINRYLLKRIEGMKNKNNHLKSDEILFDNLYELANIDKGSEYAKTEKKRVRKIAEENLKHFMSEKLIKGYEMNMRGKHFYSIKIL